MERSEEEILKQVQRQVFPEEIRVLEANPRKSIGKFSVNQRRTTEVKKSSSISRLDPFISNGLLRVGGPQSKASLSEDMKHQIILPRKNHVTSLIIEHSTLSSFIRSFRQAICFSSSAKKVLSRESQFNCAKRPERLP